jgi:hypothetical protein
MARRFSIEAAKETIIAILTAGFFRDASVLAPPSGISSLVGFHQLGPSSHSLYRLKAKMSSATGQIIFRSRQTIFI